MPHPNDRDGDSAGEDQPLGGLEGEDVPQRFVDCDALVGADRADPLSEAGQVDGRQLLDQHSGGRAIDHDLRSELRGTSGRRCRGDDDR